MINAEWRGCAVLLVKQVGKVEPSVRPAFDPCRWSVSVEAGDDNMLLQQRDERYPAGKLLHGYERCTTVRFFDDNIVESNGWAETDGEFPGAIGYLPFQGVLQFRKNFVLVGVKVQQYWQKQVCCGCQKSHGGSYEENVFFQAASRWHGGGSRIGKGSQLTQKYTPVIVALQVILRCCGFYD